MDNWCKTHKASERVGSKDCDKIACEERSSCKAYMAYSNPHYYIFEKRFCKFANNHMGAFDCKAPTDEAMTCR